MKLTIFAFAILSLFTFNVSFTNAYFTTSQDAVLLSDGGALFTIVYEFGSNRYDYLMPLFTYRDNTNSKNLLQIGYNIVDENNEVISVGESLGLVLSDAIIVNEKYRITKGQPKRMMLFVVFNPKSKKDIDISKLRLQVHSLPFVQIQNGTEFKGSLNSTELNHYQTPIVGKR